jgi:hypothetical protein
MVLRIERPAENIAPPVHIVLLAKLLGASFLVVMHRAQGRELIKWRERLRGRAPFPAFLGDRSAMVHHFRRDYFANLQAGFAERITLQF